MVVYVVILLQRDSWEVTILRVEGVFVCCGCCNEGGLGNGLGDVWVGWVEVGCGQCRVVYKVAFVVEDSLAWWLVRCVALASRKHNETLRFG